MNCLDLLLCDATLTLLPLRQVIPLRQESPLTRRHRVAQATHESKGCIPLNVYSDIVFEVTT
jgi:hypothetical protein